MKPANKVREMLQGSTQKPVTTMKPEYEIKRIHTIEVEIASLLLEQLKGDLAKKLTDQALLNLYGKNRCDYGDTGMAKLIRYAKEAVESLASKIEQVEESNPPEPTVSESTLKTIQGTLNKKKGRFYYDLILNNERIITFQADSQKEANDAVKILEGAKASRVTKGQIQSRSIAYSCSPESETYWSS